MSEVSAVVLSVGEPYTARAIESLAAQTMPLSEVIVVENISPFFRAINEGARRVRTPFFVQVDADMILDSTCVEVLRARMRDGTGIVVGELRDALVGQAVGIKLFRTECFRCATMPDSISPDTDFGTMIREIGWETAYIEGADGLRPALGEHRPAYTPSYTYRKLILEGSRLRHRGARDGMRWSMSKLEESSHAMAVLAQVALAHGFFLDSERDGLGAPTHDPRAEWLNGLLNAGGRADTVASGLRALDVHARLRDVFRHYRSAGEALARERAGATCREILAGLPCAARDGRALVAKVALGHGVLMDQTDRARQAADERAFRNFMLFSLGRHAGLVDHLRERLARLAAGRRGSGVRARW